MVSILSKVGGFFRAMKRPEMPLSVFGWEVKLWLRVVLAMLLARKRTP